MMSFFLAVKCTLSKTAHVTGILLLRNHFIVVKVQCCNIFRKSSALLHSSLQNVVTSGLRESDKKEFLFFKTSQEGHVQTTHTHTHKEAAVKNSYTQQYQLKAVRININSVI